MDLKTFIAELQKRLAEGEEEIFIEHDGWLEEFELEHRDEAFDGFYTAYPACCVIKPKES